MEECTGTYKSFSPQLFTRTHTLIASFESTAACFSILCNMCSCSLQTTQECNYLSNASYKKHSIVIHNDHKAKARGFFFLTNFSNICLSINRVQMKKLSQRIPFAAALILEVPALRQLSAHTKIFPNKSNLNPKGQKFSLCFSQDS